MRLETLAVHAGSRSDPATGAVAPPLYLSTTFERAADGSYPHGWIYVRHGNPNRAALEEAMAALEGGATALAFASGSAAAFAVFQALSPGDRVVISKDLYHGLARLFREILPAWGLRVEFVDLTDPAAVEEALRTPARLVWVETPSNPMLRITDIAWVADRAHAAGAWCFCDNTAATPILQRPLALGADGVVHSATKYLGGHGDVMGGVVVLREENAFARRLREIQITGGAVLSPFECWLILRGLRTLPYRMRAHSENAMRVAEFLARHPAVKAVHYPGLPDHPGHAIAARQMTAFGGLLSFQVWGGREAALRVAGRVRLFTRATSFGGPESLIEHRASIEGPGTSTPEDLLRLSIGLEHPDDLIEDLDQALVAETH
ncbi:MAG: aminotransferase class V-fold PLP-dependent enzyme [Thermoflexus hugenholtzii]|jgi:cystathionine gamma-synthase|uniref:trans-sulfuration enzyme family protein n=1 Tax=Thermoflexus TaxID=1495649 RepID=UPI001C78686F|nr:MULTISPECIES: aminotransferase class V-fold PLP-dependent enzyme [Thermoflexus]QWK09948.1 MAG: aminotransferase class V-fold PLP-dependent enzyme [Thermoflexus hugenholtzii]